MDASPYCVYIGWLSFSQRNDLAIAGVGVAAARLELFESIYAGQQISFQILLHLPFGGINRERQDNELNV